jgi:hypothetical protein
MTRLCGLPTRWLRRYLPCRSIRVRWRSARAWVSHGCGALGHQSKECHSLTQRQPGHLRSRLTHAVSVPMLVFVRSMAMRHQNDGSMYRLRNTGNLPGKDLPEMQMSRSNWDARTSSQTLVVRNLGFKWFAVFHSVEILSVTACAPTRLGEGQWGGWCKSAPRVLCILPRA